MTSTTPKQPAARRLRVHRPNEANTPESGWFPTCAQHPFHPDSPCTHVDNHPDHQGSPAGLPGVDDRGRRNASGNTRDNPNTFSLLAIQ